MPNVSCIRVKFLCHRWFLYKLPLKYCRLQSRCFSHISSRTPALEQSDKLIKLLKNVFHIHIYVPIHSKKALNSVWCGCCELDSETLSEDLMDLWWSVNWFSSEITIKTLSEFAVSCLKWIMPEERRCLEIPVWSACQEQVKACADWVYWYYLHSSVHKEKNLWRKGKPLIKGQEKEWQQNEGRISGAQRTSRWTVTFFSGTFFAPLKSFCQSKSKARGKMKGWFGGQFWIWKHHGERLLPGKQSYRDTNRFQPSRLKAWVATWRGKKPAGAELPTLTDAILLSAPHWTESG